MISVLKKTIKENGFTNKSISEKILSDYEYKISKESIAKYSDGSRTPEPKLLVILSDILNVSVDYLIGNDTKVSRFVPIVGLVSSSSPQQYKLGSYESIPIEDNFYSVGVYAVRCDDDSMLPKIVIGSAVYCDSTAIVKDGDIVHYLYNGKSGIKKYKINDTNTITSLVPTNTDQDIITIDEYQSATLSMAKVVGVVDMNY